MRTCGDCTMCCKIMAVKELAKPVNEWCTHCKIGKGCGIYAERPESCKAFECIWLQDEELPEQLRPDKSRVVLSVNEESTAIVAYVDPRQEGAWEQGAMGKLLMGMAEKLPVIIVCGDRRKVITKDPNISLTEQRANGEEVKYAPNAKAMADMLQMLRHKKGVA